MNDVTIHPPPSSLRALLTALDRARIQDDLTRLCDAVFAGRRIGTDGHDHATAWLHQTMIDRSLVVESFDFTLELPVLDLPTPPTFAVVDAAGTVRENLAHRRIFAEHPASADCPQPITGLAQRLSTDADLRGIWVILDAVPPLEALNQLGGEFTEQGAVGLLLPQHPTAEGYLSKRVVSAPPIALPLISIRADLLSSLDGMVVRAHVPLQRQSAQGRHILGRLDGADPALAATPLIVGAHYDGVGDDPGGLRLPGAADNAAGVAVVLELARVIQSSMIRPRRPILFAAFDGEEVQAQGSLAHARYLRERAVTPLIINLDGAARFNEAVWVEAGEGAEPLIAALDQAGQWLEMELVLGQVASDNRRYATAGFPSVGVALGGRGGHTPDDTMEHVDPAAMQMAARLLLATLWQLAF
jgi:aminopeptidase YwaD